MASPSSFSSQNYKFNVFASFHGPDVRKTLLSHIRLQFNRNGITMFDDQKIVRSATIGPSLVEAIKESRISIVILSKKYASSSWCLDELVEILECKKAMGQIVMTIFYGVDPSDVRKQIGKFGIAFNETCARKTEEERQKWSKALNQVSNIAGEDFLRWDNEAIMIEKIARDVLDKLNATPSRDFDGMVGIEAHLREIKSLLDLDNVEVKIVAIAGPAGIGKTTIARALYGLLSKRFQLSCFVDNLRGSYHSGFDEYGFKLHLQEQFLSKVLNQSGMRICHLGAIKENLSDQRVLIILDDVNKLKQLEALANETTWFGPGSRIVVTTENKELLQQHGINNTYHVGFPSDEDALKILCSYAFKQTSPRHGFEELSESVTKLCGKLPLGLCVVGSSLRGKKEDEWEDVVTRLETILDQDIEDVLRVGYESLDENAQTLFLHIAIFFNKEDGDLVKTMFAESDLDVKYGLKILENRSLIKMKIFSNGDTKIVMHRLLQQMGKRAIQKQEPWERQILIDAREICHVLEHAKGTGWNVHGMSFDISRISEVSIRKKAFKRMPNLQFLKVYKSKDDGNNRMHVPEEMDFPCLLRLLDWKAYPSKSLPPTFNPEHLVELNMHSSQLEYLWQGTQPLKNLKKMDLSQSKNLKQLPDLSNATNLEYLYLMGCESLIEIPSSISHLHKLEMLATVGCINLEVIPAHMNLESLQTVYLGGCSRLRNIPVMSTNIRYLFITNTAVEGVPLCPGLKTLDVSGSRNFKGLLTHLPTSLTTLNLCYTDIERIPDCFKSLHQLKGVNLRGCRRLASLPELPRSLLTLVADDCESLETVFCPLNTLKASFSFANCFKLDREARRAIIQQSFFMGKAVLPGREVPAVFDHRAKGYSLTIRPDGNPYTSFVFCVVVSRNQKSDKTIPPSLLWPHLTHKREIEREKGSAFYIIYDYTLSNMAASVDNRQYARLEPGLNGVVRSYKPPVPGRSDSPKAHQNQTTNQTVFLKPAKVHDDDEDVSSEDENETHNSNAVYYKEMIRKSNAELEPSVLDPRDEYTADSWIERNPSMVRLTGKHPFNSEAPLNRLMHHGFITPVPLHYVRNHGHVPKAQWAEWTVEVTGFVKRPMKFTMDQLVSEFAYREFAATLVCAGNRRKEQNMVKKSKGFNWGSAGVSTSVWRGVPLCDVLRRCGIFSRKGGALNVCFEGSEDLPGGAGTAGSKYGTSIKKEYAMDPSRDIILAYMQNGEYLTPDHGFPVRIIIPGFIGGRMVKWLKRIIVTTKESDNFYHFKDNRVLPSLVDAELADEEGWWYKPEYIINELNINSVITTPCHEEILPINAFTTQRPYTLKGYAYSGGGKKVTRVEVTVDGGETWNVCALDHQEKPNKYGKFWCWCFWSLEVEVLDLLSAKEIAVRAWDETLNTQPEKMIWNLMGMMNNCWFRVKTNVCKPHKGEIGIVFEHPTLPGNESGGWMAKERHLEKSADAPPSLKKSVSTPFMNTTAKMYSMSEVKKHNSADSCWIIVHGHIYDCTRFLMDHPGGSDSILINAGTDCTEEFEAIHSDKAKKMLEDYRIGELITTGYSSDSSSPNNSVHGSSAVFSLLAPIGEATPVRNLALVNPRAKVPVQLVEKTSISHDVRKFRFALPVEDMVLGLPVGKHIFLCATINDKLCLRAYTPSSTVDVVGYFELVVKIYFGGVHPRFPNGGLMSQYLDSLPIGSTLEIKGPLGHVEYLGKGSFTVHGKPKFADKLAMLAGGTGITPVYQIIQAILKDPEDETEMYVIYANRTEEDILLREELDGWAEQYPDRLKVWYVVESAKEGWAYSTGFISEAIMREHIPDGLDGSALAMACGPPPMIQFAVQPNLEKMQYNIKEDFLIF